MSLIENENKTRDESNQEYSQYSYITLNNRHTGDVSENELISKEDTPYRTKVLSHILEEGGGAADVNEAGAPDSQDKVTLMKEFG